MAGKVTEADNGNAAKIAHGTDASVGTDGSADTLADNPAAGHDHRTGAGTAAADRIDDPRAVEISAASASASALARSATRFLGRSPRLAAASGLLGLNRARR